MTDDINKKDTSTSSAQGASTSSAQGAEKNEACEKERDQYLELSKRLKADFLNLKKESEEQGKKIRESATESLVLKILPVLDSLKLALKHTPDDLKENNWVKGMLSINGQFESILRSIGIDEIKAVGEAFDANMHEAIMEEESEKESGTVLEELQKGYKLNNKTIRAAKVKISK
ncbi:nucleotide exchange factor GrpE [Candidatus Azambacteria bacterium]|nr:nucleotide exchange factor GrpE [Candidatus Azambacteria bacterium]